MQILIHIQIIMQIPINQVKRLLPYHSHNYRRAMKDNWSFFERDINADHMIYKTVHNHSIHCFILGISYHSVQTYFSTGLLYLKQDSKQHSIHSKLMLRLGQLFCFSRQVAPLSKKTCIDKTLLCEMDSVQVSLLQHITSSRKI